MNPRTKVITFRIILVVMGVLFIGGYFHQRHQDQQQSSSQKEPQQEQKVNSEETFTPFQEEEKEETEGNNSSVSPNQGKKLSDFYSNEDIENAKKIATDFIKNYYPIDGKDVGKSVKNSIPYVNENLKRMMESEEGMMRPTGDFFSRELKGINVQEPQEATPDAVTLNVEVQGDVKNEKGEVTDRDKTTYLLQVMKEKDSFKVVEFSENPNE
ncbi:hypothetical protein [Priestia megaterium]|uniref:hypothetical protein n=1 Tax=Priestia megaterium TaxID=1404 RepID=UPI000BFA173E|nr:hypothetical protein [Priestia megaterium]PFR88889.1 hypothetical protein COK39_25600 [Priestia megaterium]